jgi:elongation of very long chain fatty acids protein 6
MGLATFLAYQAAFDGHDAQQYFATHPRIPIVAVVLYLLMVRYGTRYMEHQPAFKLRRVSQAWNLAIALFSLCGAVACVPHLALVLLRHGFWYSTCADVYDLAGYGAPALWASLFTWSKLFELFVCARGARTQDALLTNEPLLTDSDHFQA